jgi:iron complex transport system ATP-binding protein
MPETPPVLSVRNVHYRRGRPILKGINWTVRQGEHWCVLGPNGCGKTSLINLITGYDAATEGEIRVGSDEFGKTDWREVRKRVGLVTNTLTTYLEAGEPVLHVIASGREAKLNLWQDPPPAWRKQAATLLKAVGCQYLKTAVWGTLSQGEKQKVLICRALMAKFQVLILDEPCAGLDPVAREHFLDWMSELSTWPEAPSLVMVTHHVEEILPCISHVLMLRDGEVFGSGEKGKVMSSAALSAVYGAEVKLTLKSERYALQVLK